MFKGQAAQEGNREGVKA